MALIQKSLITTDTRKSMDRKISASVLVDELSARCTIPQTVSEDFVRAFFDIIVDGLRKDGLVKIKGFGTFKLQEVADRESVAVATGERIVIKGFRKVTFTPEAALKDRINKPFAQFETIELEDGCQFDDVQETIVPENDDAVSDEQVTIVEEIVDDIPPMPFEEPQLEESESPSQIKVIEQEREVEEAISSVASLMEDKAKQEIPDVEENVASNDIVPDVEENDAVSVETYFAAESVKQENLVSNETKQETESEEQLATKDSSSEATEDKHELDEDYVYYTEKPRHRPFWRYWAPALLLVIAACCLYIYTSLDGKDSQFESFRPSENDMIKVQPIAFDDDKVQNEVSKPVSIPQDKPKVAPELKSEPQTDTKETTNLENKVDAEETTNVESKVDASPNSNAVVTASSKTSSEAEPVVKAQPVKNDGKPYILPLTESVKAKSIKDIDVPDTTDYIINGTLTTHELQKDETIIRLALIYYGDKRLWPYIVKYNWLKNPNNVPAGTAINIPYLISK